MENSHLSSESGPPWGEPWKSLLQILGSLKLAMVLLAVLIVACMVGTVVESRLDTSIARGYVYDAPWFIAWLLVLCVNLVCSVLLRYPWQRRHVGFIITHAGIVTILVGAIIGRVWGVEGHLTLFKGEAPVNHLIVDERLVEARVGEEGRETVRVAGFGMNPPSPSHPLKMNLEGVKVTVVDSTAELGSETQVEEGGTAGPPALHLVMRSTMVPRPTDQWLVLGDPERDTIDFGPASVRFAAPPTEPARVGKSPAVVTAATREVHFAFAKLPDMGIARAVSGRPTGIKAVYRFPADGGAGERGILQLEAGGKRHEFPVKRILEAAARVGATPWRVKALKFFADFRMEGKEPMSLSDQPNNPALMFEITGPPSAAGAEAAEGGTAVPPPGHPPMGEAAAAAERPMGANELMIYYEGPGRLRYETKSRKGVVTKGEVKAGGEFAPGWADWKFTVKKLVEHAVVRENLRPLSDGAARPTGTPGALVRVEKDGQAAMRWLRMGAPESFEVAGRKVRVTFGLRLHPLDFGVALDDFEVERDEGTQNPAGFRSRVRFVDSRSGDVVRRDIWMNHPANFPDFPGAAWLGIAYKFSQASWNPDDLNQTTLQVLRDPGWPLKWGGSLILCAGLVLIFYFSPPGEKDGKTK